MHDVTFSNCIIAEALRNVGHSKGEHSNGMLIGKFTKNIAVIRNLFAHNALRNPLLTGSSSTVVINKVVYDTRGAIHSGSDETSGGLHGV